MKNINLKLLLAFTLIIVHCALNITLAQDNVFVTGGRTKVMQWKSAGDYSAYNLLFVVVDADDERIIQKTLTQSYLNGYTTMVCTLYVADTEDLTADASYDYDIAAYGADTITVRSGLFNLIDPVQTSFNGTNLPEGVRVTTVSLANATTLNSVVVWDTTNGYWAPMSFADFEALLNIAVASVGNADSLGGVPAASYFLDSDTVGFRTFSDLKYLENTDSTALRTFSDLKYLENGDSTAQRTFSDLKYPSKDSIQTWAETEALIADIIADSLSPMHLSILALYDSITAIRQTTGYTVVDSPYDIISPDTVYLANAQANYIFYDNIGIGFPESPSVTFTPDSGDAYATNWVFTPSSSGDYSFYLTVEQDTFHTIMQNATGPVMITRGKLLAIGDSRTAAGQWVTELKTLVGDSLTLIGTLGTPPYLHEGISGWAYQTFCTNVASPFAPNGYVDFSSYMTDNSFDSLDYVIIRLGTNDVFSANSSTITATITTALNYADSLINSIHSYDASVLIALCMETPPANDSTFNATYGITQSYAQYKSNIHAFNKALKVKYGNGGTRELSYVDLIPLYLSSDKDNDFANGVHENTAGYEKNAIPMLGWLWNKRIVYMDNIVVNGTFDTNVDSWLENNTPSLFEWAGGEAHIMGGVNDGIYQSVAIDSGSTYSLSFNINIISGSAIRTGVFLVSHQGYADYSSLGEHSYSTEFTATKTGSAYLWTYSTTDDAEWYIDNISLRGKY